MLAEQQETSYETFTQARPPTSDDGDTTMDPEQVLDEEWIGGGVGGCRLVDFGLVHDDFFGFDSRGDAKLPTHTQSTIGVSLQKIRSLLVWFFFP